MAAVQPTPTPDEPRSSRKFMDAMEDELRRVQEHLDRRNRTRSSFSSASSREGVSPGELRREARTGEGGSPRRNRSGSSIAASRPWYTLELSNPVTSDRLKPSQNSPPNLPKASTLAATNSSRSASSRFSATAEFLYAPEQKRLTLPARKVSDPPHGAARLVTDEEDDDDDEEDEDDDDDDEEEEEEEEEGESRVFETGRKLVSSGQWMVKSPTQNTERRLGLQQDDLQKEKQQLIDKLQQKLKDKEQELKDLHVRYNREVRLKDDKLKKLTKDVVRLDKEKWELLKRAREATERSVNLRTKFDLNDSSLRAVQSELEHTNDELQSARSANNSLRLLVNELRAAKTTKDASVQTTAMETTSRQQRSFTTSSLPVGGRNTPDDTSSLGTDSRGGTPVAMAHTGVSLSSMYQLDPARPNRPSVLTRFRKTSSSMGNRNSSSSMEGFMLSQASSNTGYPLEESRSPFHISTASLQSVPEQTDNQLVLDEFTATPFHQWNTRALAAWMDVVVGMPRYVPMVREKVTSGHAMLALSNSDMERKLGITHPLHRRRLRIVIEEQRDPQKRNMYPSAVELDHNWVAYQWAVDCGLPHISSLLYTGMVDGRVLNSLSTREELKKYLKLSKKVEQQSFLTGVELLRMHEFKKETIKAHRRIATNALYWTNKDVVEWLKKDFADYADNVTSSGIHGALLFLERGSFSSHQLATALKIPSSKTKLRKKLTSCLVQLFAEEVPGDDNDMLPVDQSLTPVLSDNERLVDSSPSHSPHPVRRLNLTHANSDTDLSGSPNPFSRNSGNRLRMSLRESNLQTVNLPPPIDRRRETRPIEQHRLPKSFLSQTTV